MKKLESSSSTIIALPENEKIKILEDKGN
jgi:hypothetical protein